MSNQFFLQVLSEKPCRELEDLGTTNDTLAHRQCPVALPGCTRVYSPSSSPMWNKALCKHTVRSYVTGSDWSIYIGVKYAYKECLCRASLCKLEWENTVCTKALQVSIDIFILLFIYFLYNLHYIIFHYLFCWVYWFRRTKKGKKRKKTRQWLVGILLWTLNYCLSCVQRLKMYRQYAFLVTWIYFIGVVGFLSGIFSPDRDDF